MDSVRFNGSDFNYSIDLEGGSLASKIFQKVSNKFRKGRSRPLEEYEYHAIGHNYTGPGTRIDLYGDIPPYNNIDNCSRTHDFDYLYAENINDPKLRQQRVRKADEDAINCYDQYPNESGYKAAKFFIKNKTKVEDVSPSIIRLILGEKYVGSK
jgi:hypothetical protein